MFGLLGKKKALEPRMSTESQKYSFVSAEANNQMASAEFRRASPFVRAYGRALADVVPVHVEALILVPTNAPTVVEKWQKASEAHVLDLAALLAWLHAKAAFNDVDALYQPDAREAMYRTLMTISGHFFGTAERAMSLCQQYEACMQGDYQSLGGGTLDEGGTYFVHPDSAFVTTHLWMINESLGGPPLNMKDRSLNPATIYYLQTYTCRVMNELNDAFLKRAQAELSNLR